MCEAVKRLSIMKIRTTENGYVVATDQNFEYSFESFDNLMKFIRENLELRESQYQCPRLM
jgi:hypothetical protein